MVEKCVSGTMHKVGIVNKQDKDATDEKINVKPLQWSLSAAAGAQFKITEKVGIYAEPVWFIILMMVVNGRLFARASF